MREYDVIIVGCGPAGVAAAKVLGDNKVSFCMIDKTKFPREKLCGGGLTHKSVILLNKLGFTLDKIRSNDVGTFNLVSDDVNRILKLVNPIKMIDRIEFDYNNLKQVTNDNLFLEEKIIDIDNNILVTDKHKYKFKYIIFADGVYGFSRKFIAKRNVGFAAEYYAKEVPDNIVLDFGVIESGYGWIFPKEDHTVIGLGNCNGKKEDYLALLDSFGKKYNIKIDKDKVRGFHIPIFTRNTYRQSVINNKYILVGDAACLVDRVSGEGIYYALLSGKMAAKSIIACLNSNKNLKRAYFKNTRMMYLNLRYREFLSKLLYSKYRQFYIKLGLSNKLFIKILNCLFG